MKTKTWSKCALLFLIAACILSLGVKPDTLSFYAKIHPSLVEKIRQSPAENVRVMIIHKGHQGITQELSRERGIHIIKQLSIIPVITAEIPLARLPQLATKNWVRWITPDQPVNHTARPLEPLEFTIEDNFDQIAYNQHSGSVPWESEWMEFDPIGAGAEQGAIFIRDGELHLTPAEPPTEVAYIEREADLSGGAEFSTLSFDVHTTPCASSQTGTYLIKVSSDGGASYSTLGDLEAIVLRNEPGFTANISSFVSGDLRIRFELAPSSSNQPLCYALDNLVIAFKGKFTRNFYLDTLNVLDVWEMGITGAGVGIAIIDSGITADADLEHLVFARTFNDNANNTDDYYGHGTHIAGIIAGNGHDSGGVYRGIAPDVHLINIKISDENGMAYESDTVEAMQWILENKDQYNIRVVNLSVQSSTPASYHQSPLDAAAEILWFNGIAVVASAGNKGGSFNPLHAPPGNDPFLITVGASDEKGDAHRKNDSIAHFSPFGMTQDGFLKPEIIAPGVNIVSVLSHSSEWIYSHPDRVIFGQYFRLSGTSMSVPMVSAAIALLLQDEPNLNPDQVKFRLMATASRIGKGKYLDVLALINGTTTATANTGTMVSALLWTGDDPPNWGSVNWGSVNWGSVNWGSVNWGSVNWGSVNWGSVNWGSVFWED